MASTSPHHRRDQTRTYDRSCSVVFLKTKDPFGGLSNMAGGFPLVVNGVSIRTSEALYQACRFPHLPDVQRLIIAQRSPMTAKMKSKPYRHDSRADWNRVRVNVMRWCLRVKLAQNWGVFGKLLLDTGSRPIVEQSRKDAFWGTRPANDRTLVGTNVLGRLLMELRERIKAEPRENFRRVEPLPIANFLLGGRPIDLVTDGRPERAGSVVELPVRPPHYKEPKSTDIQLPFSAPRITASPFREIPTAYTVSGGDGLKEYPAYKESGVEWLGAVPAHWEVRQLGRFGRLFKGGGGTKEDERESGVPCVRYGDLYTQHQLFITATRACVTPELANTVYTPIRYGDVLFAGSGETVDEIGKSAVNLIPGPACCGGDVIIFRPSIDGDARFLGYAMDCAATARQKARIGRGFTVVHIYSSDLKYVTVAIPSLPEQAAIVRFLDHADRRIRRFMRAKQKLIALLEEQKQAILHEAVTGQINVRTGRPYPAYKDSGVAWLEKVPAHWGFRRLKSLVKWIDQGVSPRAENYVAASGSWGVLKAGCVNRGEFRDSEHKRLPSDFVFDPALTVRIGDVLVSRASGSARFVGSVGRVSALKYRLILSDKTFRPVFTDEADPDFMVLAMNGPYYRQQVGRAISGAEGLANNLPLSSLRAFRFAIPAIDEQREVVRYVTTLWDDKLGRALERAKREAALVREYRARLIADVVTGKLDVRAAAARLPEVDLLDAEVDDDFNRQPRLGRDRAAEEGGPLPDVVDAERSDAAAGELMAEGR